MRWEKHIEAASGEQSVDRVEIAEWITARRRAPMDTLRPAAETTDTDWVGIDNLDVVTCRSQHTQEFACRQTGAFGEQDPRAHMALRLAESVPCTFESPQGRRTGAEGRLSTRSSATSASPQSQVISSIAAYSALYPPKMRGYGNPYSQELQTPLCTCRDVWKPRRCSEESGCRGRCNESGRQLPQLSSPEREPHDHQHHQPDADLQHGDGPERDILERVPAHGAKHRLVPRGAGGIHHQEHDPQESQIPSGD